MEIKLDRWHKMSSRKIIYGGIECEVKAIDIKPTVAEYIADNLSPFIIDEHSRRGQRCAHRKIGNVYYIFQTAGSTNS